MAPITPGRRRSRLRAVLLALPIALLALILLTGAAAFVALSTDWGAGVVWRAATYVLGDKLTGQLTSGNLSDGMVVKNLHYRDAKRIVRLDRLAGSWHMSFSPATLTVNRLELGQVDITLLPAPPTPPLQLPDRITLPIAFDLKHLAIGTLIVHQSGSDTRIGAIRASARSDRMHHQLHLEHADTSFGTLQGTVRLDGTAPFALAGTVGLVTMFEQQRYTVDGTLSGTLRSLDLAVRAGGGKLAGSADITAAPFDPVPLRQIQLAVQHLDPRVFNPGAPQADLDLQATLVPVAGAPGPGPGPGPAAAAAAPVVRGPIVIRNGAPGRLDQGRLPLLTARADVLLSADLQRVNQLAVTLLGDARLSGAGVLRKGGAGGLNLHVAQLDLHALHDALTATRLDGPLDIDLHQGTQDLSLQLSSTKLSIAATAHVDATRVQLQSARLQAGSSQLHLSGSLDRGAQSSYAVKAELKDFDPATVLEQLRPPRRAVAGGQAGKSGNPSKSGKSGNARNAGAGAVHARINMDLSAEGAMQPELGAKLNFAIHDSSYNQLPLTGGGTLQVRGKRLLASDAKLSIAGNDVAIKGSFGTAPDRLAFHLEAPALARLGFGLAGQLQADGRLAGTLAQPIVDATFQAHALALGERSLASLSGEAHLDGMPSQNPNARLVLTLEARGVRDGTTQLEKLSARINGSFAQHTIDLTAAGRLSGQPLALTVAAQGNLKQAPDLAWDGVVRTLDNRGVPRLAIGAPLTVRIAPGRLELGATRLTLGPAEIDLKGFQYRPGLIHSEGSFAALHVADVLALQRRFTGVAAPVTTTLVLDGSWNVELGSSARGFAQITRRSGDVVVATPFGANAIGLSTLRLRADLQGQRVMVDSRLAASRIGTLAVQGTVGLLQNGSLPGIGAASSLSGKVEGALPMLRNFATLTGPSIALDGSVSIAMNVAGTLGEPVVSGTLDGEHLAVTLFDQGVRLRDGTAHIVLNNNFVELRDVVFHGGSGTLRATGRIPLAQTDTGLTALVTADHLQLLNDPARKLTLSGQASIANISHRLTVDGRFNVDQGRFSLPDKSAPKLSDDVIIVHQGALSKPKVASVQRPVARVADATAPGLLPPKVNVVIDLGKDLRFKGAGADIFLAGAIDIRSGPSQPPQAFGTVRVVSGTYEAFGARLDIERGLITFQGPFDNPSINLLAMRRNQAVPAGVQVTGNVQQPRVELVSEPNLGEDQKLSWLVFGRGDSAIGSSGSSAGGAAHSVALGLLNKFGGASLANNFGLDKLSIGASEYGTGAGQVVNLGKEISNKLFIGYEQGLAGAESAVKLTYQFTRNWSLVLRGGAIAGLDVNYSRRFDHFPTR